MTVLKFIIKDQPFEIEVPDGFEIVVADDKVTVRSNFGGGDPVNPWNPPNIFPYYPPYNPNPITYTWPPQHYK